MAKLNASKFTNRDILVTGTDPSTGEYLSAAQRKALFRKKKISSNQVFRKPGAIVKVGSSAITSDVDVNVLNARVIVVENQVSFLAKVLDKEAELNKKAQKDRENQALQEEERGLRSGKEKQLESGLFKALISPVKAVGGVAKGILQRLMEFFGLLLVGWLTDKGWKAIAAWATGDNQKLEEIRNEVVKTLGIVGGIFLALNGGIGAILGIIGGIITGIGGLALGGLINAFRGGATPQGGGGATPQGGGGAKPQGGGLFGAIRQFGRNRLGIGANAYTSPIGPQPLDSGPKGLGGWAKAGAGETGDVFGNVPRLESGQTKGLKFWIDKATNNVKGIFKKAPGKAFGMLTNLFSGLGNIPGIGGPAKSLGKMFGFFGGLVGKGSKFLLKFAGGLAKKAFAGLQILFAVQDVAKRLGEGKSPAQALIPILVQLATTSAGSIAGSVIGSALPIAGTGIGYVAGTGLGVLLGDWFKNLLDGAWNSSWDSAPGLKQINEFGRSIGLQGSGSMSQESGTEAVSSPSAPSAPSIDSPSSPSIDSPSSPSMQIPGPVSSAGNTTVIYKKIGGSGQAQQQALKTGSATDVPLIASANPDNFYTIYSQLIYNVVI
jgi:hypothetical protein